MKSDNVRKNIFGNKSTDIYVSEGSRNNSFSSVAEFSKLGISAELGNMKVYIETEKHIKLEGVRHIILGNKNSESEFRELSVHVSTLRHAHTSDVLTTLKVYNQKHNNLTRRHIYNKKESSSTTSTEPAYTRRRSVRPHNKETAYHNWKHIDVRTIIP